MQTIQMTCVIDDCYIQVTGTEEMPGTWMLSVEMEDLLVGRCWADGPISVIATHLAGCLDQVRTHLRQKGVTCPSAQRSGPVGNVC